jgi:tRNA dimethylallyltransferase
MQKINGEVISADSMQIYKKMNIGTAKPDLAEQEGIPHLLMSIIEPFERFSVSQYCDLAQETAVNIYKQGKLPVLAGGTGLYINSLIDNIKFFDIPNDFKYREDLENLAKARGSFVLWEMLYKIDKAEAERISENDIKRIIRALEIFHTTGQTKSHFKIKSKEEPSIFIPLFIGLKYNDRQLLYDKIRLRVDLMIKQGLIDELKSLLSVDGFVGSTGYYAIGYKEIIEYLNGGTSQDEAINRIKLATTRYAKRQMTWFSKNQRINWICIDQHEQFYNVIDYSLKLVERFLKCI